MRFLSLAANHRRDIGSYKQSALRAWNQLWPIKARPRRIEELRREKKTAAYRIFGLGPRGSAVIAKRSESESAAVERIIYEEILPHLSVQTLRYYGQVIERGGAYTWTFLEDAGEERYSARISKHRVAAARWLGLAHATFTRFPMCTSLPDRGPRAYLQEMCSTGKAIGKNLTNPALTSGDLSILRALLSEFETLESRWRVIEAVCRQLPGSLVHGDLAEKNLRLRELKDDRLLLPFDWETAGWGPPAVDIAQFILDSASPDLGAYLSIVRDFWPGVNAEDLRNVARIGAIFRLINAITWEHLGIVHQLWAERGIAFECARASVAELRRYKVSLARAVRAAPVGA
jgi:phosphotransferase family enzyme